MSDLDILKDYINEVIGMTDAALALLGAIVWKKDEETIAVSSEGANKKSLTIKLNGAKYIFSHNSKAERIDMHSLTDGMLMYSFTNQTPVSKIREVFETL
jgi:hypothetical protein